VTRVALAACLAAALLCAGRTRAAPFVEERDLPIKVQVALFRKILAYDRAFEGQVIRLLIVHPEGKTKSLRTWVELFQQLGVRTSVTVETDWPAAVGGQSVVYFVPGVDAARLRAHCVEKRILTLSSVAADAEEGHASVALGVLPDGRPEIVVNRARLRDEGHAFSSALLQLARLVPGGGNP
jgi:hypothetical protein